MERAREYTRALNAVKLERIFAKPFLGALDGHTDAVRCLAKTKSSLTPLFSGSCDGEIKLWNLAQKRTVRSVRAHQGFVRGMCTAQNDKFLFSCGDDKTIKQWLVKDFEQVQDNEEDELEAYQTFHSSSLLTSIDHHWKQSMFATSGETVDVWDHHRSTPLHSFEWGCDYVLSTRFNPAESCLLASTGADNSIGLYDLRGSSAIRKVILKHRSNALCWNPREPVNFTVANEDGNLYTFDMRNLSQAMQEHKDHVMAVLDVDYSADGSEFVSASYDKTVRIFNIYSSKSKEVYHTKRMQRVLACRYSADTRFVFTGSEDTNVRIWKAKAWEKLGALSAREKTANAYREKLKERFQHLPEVKRIKRHRHVPKIIKSIQNQNQIVMESKKRKEANVRKHIKTAPAAIPRKKKHVRKEEE